MFSTFALVILHMLSLLMPDFDDKILEFDLVLKGRIYIGTLVAVLLKLYFNKKVKRFIHIMKKENANG